MDCACVVIGAGIHGLCTAFWLRQLGVRPVLVLERGEPGHRQGSSHGATRITRSSYDDPHFVALARRAHQAAWPQLERVLGRALRLPTPGVFFGPADGPLAGYAATTRAAGVAVEPLAVAAARTHFPLLRFDDDDAVLLDHTAAVVLAGATMAGLREWLVTHDVALEFATQVLAVEPTDRGVTVRTATARTGARHAVLACGAWTSQLAGAAPPLVVLRQEVGWFELAAPPAATAAGTFPVWARIGRTAEDFVYGLPAVANEGVKLARHRTTGPGIDPDAAPPAIDAAALSQLAAERFAVPVLRAQAPDRCLYTMTADQRFSVATDRARRCTTIAACSGHAFKFGPVIGHDAAQAVVAALESGA